MNATKWNEIKALLDQTLSIEPSRRMVFLQEAGVSCELLAEVESLLAFEGQSEDFMSLDAECFSKDLIVGNAAVSSLDGLKIGVYKITGELGFGGMGAVYLAERIDGEFDRKVAVKMLRRELNTVKLRRNFTREREILSKLCHPNIAKLLDAGKTDDGVPYLVMEYVDGLPIDEFCRVRNLSLKARLKLFHKVCDAVAYAHRNLVIHRDIKPSNILVTETGEPKLLDFGISKLLGADDVTKVTEIGAMTPEYASPEQIRGETVSTATDVYTLGVVLYKILTGVLPFGGNGETNGSLLKSITDDEPVSPSTAINHRTADAEGKPETIHQISRSLRGDLDNIILKAIAKEPERRYESVGDFEADLLRHLDGLPVSARPATRSYRAGKFIRRHKMPVVAVAMVLLSLVIGITVAIWQAREARAHAANSALETEKAREEQRKSEKVTKFVSKIFGYANPGWFAEGAKTQGKARVIDVVEELSGKIDSEFADEPDVAAELHSTFASIFHWVSKNAPPEVHEQYQKKRRYHALRGIELRKQNYGEFHELVAVDMYGTYGMIGNSEDERAAYLMKGINMMRATNPRNINFAYMFEAYAARLIIPETEQYHQAFLRAVDPPTDENRYQVAERMLREALDVWKLHYPPDHAVILTKSCWLTFALAKQEKWAELDEAFRDCRQIEIRSRTEDEIKPLMPEYKRVESLLRELGRFPSE